MIKAVILDFDGTIADSFEVFVKTLHILLRKDAAPSDSEIQDLRGKQVKEIMSLLGIKPWQVAQLVVRGRKEIAGSFDSVKVFSHVPNLIKQLSKKYTLYIVSTNSKHVIADFLNKNELQPYFKAIYADIGLMSKPASLKRLMRTYGYKASEVMYIGDEVRDSKAAQKVKMKCISVDWGYSTRESLEQNNPGYVASSVDEVLAIMSAYENANSNLRNT